MVPLFSAVDMVDDREWRMEGRRERGSEGRLNQRAQDVRDVDEEGGWVCWIRLLRVRRNVGLPSNKVVRDHNTILVLQSGRKGGDVDEGPLSNRANSTKSRFEVLRLYQEREVVR
jgi:general stress protein YciG